MLLIGLVRRFSRINLTESCVEQIRRLCEGNKLVRVSVEAGEGCSGFSYHFDIINKEAESDEVIEKEGAKLVVDKDSVSKLEGATIDYTQELIRRSFVVKNNPNAQMTCGCGTSFYPKKI